MNFSIRVYFSTNNTLYKKTSAKLKNQELKHC